MQGHAGGVISSAEWELPTGSSAKIGWLSLSCRQRDVHSAGRVAKLCVQHSTAQACAHPG